MQKNVVRILLVVVTICLLLGSCNKGGTSSQTSGSASGENYDFGGRVFRYASLWDCRPTPGKSAFDDAFSAYLSTIETKYNCKFESVVINGTSDSYFNTLYTSLANGEDKADFWYCGSGYAIPAYAKNGLILSPDDYGYFDYNSSISWNRSMANDYIYNGKHWLFSYTDIFEGYNDLGTGIFFNKDMVNRLGLENPHDLYDKNEWTWAKFRELAVAATGDTDKDGETDRWGVANIQYEDFVVSNGSGIVTQDASGKYVYGLDQPDAVEGIEFFRKFHSDKLVYPYGGEEGASSVAGGQTLMGAGEKWMCGAYTDSIDTIAWVPFPMGPKSTKYTLNRSGTTGTIVPASVKNPEEVFKFYDLLGKFDTSSQFEDSVSKYFKEEKSVELLRKAYDEGWSKHGLSGCVTGLADVSQEALMEYWEGEKSAQAAMSGMSLRAQALIDMVFLY